jgi:hypothetical protein
MNQAKAERGGGAVRARRRRRIEPFSGEIDDEVGGQDRVSCARDGR